MCPRSCPDAKTKLARTKSTCREFLLFRRADIVAPGVRSRNVLDNSTPTSNSESIKVAEFCGRERDFILRSFLPAKWPRDLFTKVRLIIQRQTIRAIRALRKIGWASLFFAKHHAARARKRLVLTGRRILLIPDGLQNNLSTYRVAARRQLALSERRIILTRYGLQNRLARHSRIGTSVALIAFIIASYLFAPALQGAVESYFTADRLSLLRNLLATTGGALVGATAIGFSVVMIAVQLNFARMPHGLFRMLSSDFRLLGAFAMTFLLAIGVSALSLVPDASWSAIALISATWATLLILLLFFYGYRRALDLINPTVQLRLVAATAQKELRRWARRAQRMAPLATAPARDEAADAPSSKHDLPRLVFFKANPQWTGEARRAVAHAISFARRYAEQGDFEVSGRALEVVVLINATYVATKGRTFLASNPIFETSQATDGFINETLEHLRQLAQASTQRGDEEAIRQTLRAMAALVRTYMTIDYAEPRAKRKEHAHLAAGYLTAAVDGALPRNLPDVVMEGLRLAGASAQAFLVIGQPNEIISLVEKIAAFSIVGVVKPDYRVLTLTGMEQLANLTFDLLRTQAHHIDYAAKHLREHVELVVQIFLGVPDAPLTNIHSSYLAPYYSLTKTQTLGDKLTQLSNALIDAARDDKVAIGILRNIQTWSDELYRTEKTLLLLAIEKKSHFTFDSLHWIAHVTKLLLALARAPIADEYARTALEKNANWLISVISWIPENKEATQFIEAFAIIELLFETTLDAIQRESTLVTKSGSNLLIGWAFKAGQYENGWGTFYNTMLALITLVLWKEELRLVPWLKSEVVKRLNDQSAPKQEIRDRAARQLRGQRAFVRPKEFELNRVRHAMNQIDRAKVRELLTEMADILSPLTAAEPISPNDFD
jgi:hypothetical protein